MGIFLFLYPTLFKLCMVVAITFTICFRIALLERTTTLLYIREAGIDILILAMLTGVSAYINTFTLFFLIVCPEKYMSMLFRKLNIMEEK